jgi:hypothetical protein
MVRRWRLIGYFLILHYPPVVQGVIRNITYERLRLIDVTCPILIEQFYCASSQHPRKCANSTRAVQVSHVTFRDIRGTQTSSAVGQVRCCGHEHSLGWVGLPETPFKCRNCDLFETSIS